MATIPFKRVDDAEGLAIELYENIMRTYGLDEPPGIYQLMGTRRSSWPPAGRAAAIFMATIPTSRCATSTS